MARLEVILRDYLRQLERQYKRGERLRALKKRRRWRKADVPRLLNIGVSPAAQLRAAKLLNSKSSGRGLVGESKSFSAFLFDGWDIMRRLIDPTTSAHERRDLYQKTPWWPYIVEAAYRGELSAALKAKGDVTLPHQTASMIAADKVAAAAGIPVSKVRRISEKVRKERGFTLPDDPPTSAKQLRRRLKEGPRP